MIHSYATTLLDTATDASTLPANRRRVSRRSHRYPSNLDGFPEDMPFLLHQEMALPKDHHAIHAEVASGTFDGLIRGERGRIHPSESSGS